MSDSEWMEAFEESSLPNGSFHHADHVKMAFLYLRKYAPLEALARFSSALTRFAAPNGKPNLYNETITWAFCAAHSRTPRTRRRSAKLGRVFRSQSPISYAGRTTFLKNTIVRRH